MKPARYLLGIDGGGSRSEAVLQSLDAGEAVVLRGGPLNAHTDGEAKARGHLLALLEQAEERLAERGGVLAAAAVAAACNTGPDKDAHWSVETARERFPDARIAGMEDTEAALEGAFAGGPGILVIAGTGSAAAARTEEGRLLSCGGWGPWFGDEGSGYWLGCEALRAAARAADGRGERTRLEELLAERLGLPSFAMEEAVRRLYGSWGRKEIASLTRQVAEAAAQGDAAALALLEQAAEHLAELAQALHRASERSLTRVSYVGGVFAIGEPVLGPWRLRLEQSGLTAAPPLLTPPQGAVEYARKQLRGDPRERRTNDANTP
ncbi:BadF/BadG/BcrA/BcrD ATPase family protein [Paenibacillus aurantius]|uniref:BadF/BadG/BcrA/BcrD ATPase family protein n=1 Tax=Paenibacillus aurantius TaxID=2918900 RepID=A0AA96RH52_9BACL|nr:BadF/BadG/BcrA/BcrD ATPase family protein [Paenibacillus aurantius]WNQ10769.1 BadF/BadG/BcrA/BcrD ATPase family protein [Paenibacillus aurantius]